MTLTPDMLSAAASIVSSVVIVFTALAAFRQLKHMRNANEIQAFSAIVERWSSPQTAQSREIVFALEASVRDADWLAEVRQRPLPERPTKMLPILALFEEIGTLVDLQIVSERAIMTNYAPTILRVWRISEPAIRIMRDVEGATLYRMFEHLSARALHWQINEEPKLAQRLEKMPDTTRAAQAASAIDSVRGV